MLLCLRQSNLQHPPFIYTVGRVCQWVCPDMQKYRVYNVRVRVRMELFSKRKCAKQTEKSAHVCDRGESQQQSRWGPGKSEQRRNMLEKAVVNVNIAFLNKSPLFHLGLLFGPSTIVVYLTSKYFVTLIGDNSVDLWGHYRVKGFEQPGRKKTRHQLKNGILFFWFKFNLFC